MKLKGKNAGGSGDFEAGPAGVFTGKVVDLIPFPNHRSVYNGEETFRDCMRLVIAYEAESEVDGDQKVFLASWFGTASLHAKANFRPYADSLLGEDYGLEGEIDFEKLRDDVIGKYGLFQISQRKTNDGKVFVDVKNAMQPPKKYDEVDTSFYTPKHLREEAA